MTVAGIAWLGVCGVVALVFGILLVLGGRGIRRKRGLGFGRTLALDDVTLYSARYGLAGRPDRIVQERQGLIPEEWKSSKSLRAWHRAQMGIYGSSGFRARRTQSGATRTVRVNREEGSGVGVWGRELGPLVPPPVGLCALAGALTGRSRRAARARSG